MVEVWFLEALHRRKTGDFVMPEYYCAYVLYLTSILDRFSTKCYRPYAKTADLNF